MLQGFPTIKFFYVSDGKIKSSEFRGGRSAKDIVTFALDKVGGHSLHAVLAALSNMTHCHLCEASEVGGPCSTSTPNSIMTHDS